MRWLFGLGALVCFAVSVILQAGSPGAADPGAAANVAGMAGALNLVAWACVAGLVVSLIAKRTPRVKTD